MFLESTHFFTIYFGILLLIYFEKSQYDICWAGDYELLLVGKMLAAMSSVWDLLFTTLIQSSAANDSNHYTRW